MSVVHMSMFTRLVKHVSVFLLIVPQRKLHVD